MWRKNRNCQSRPDLPSRPLGVWLPRFVARHAPIIPACRNHHLADLGSGSDFHGGHGVHGVERIDESKTRNRIASLRIPISGPTQCPPCSLWKNNLNSVQSFRLRKSGGRRSAKALNASAASADCKRAMKTSFSRSMIAWSVAGSRMSCLVARRAPIGCAANC